MFDPQHLYQELRPYLVRPANPERSGRIWSYCPAHDDGVKDGRNTPPNLRGSRSLSLSPKTGVQCFAGCTFGEIMAAFKQLGFESGNPPPRPLPKRRITSEVPFQIVDVYNYCTKDGSLVAIKARLETVGPDGKPAKKFLWKTPDSENWNGLPFGIEKLPLFGAELLDDRPDDIVYFTEGEKAAKACREQGLLAVCAGVGASRMPRISHALADLQGRRVALWPDNDEKGIDYMNAVKGMLAPIAKEIIWITVPVPEKGDAYDFFANGGTVDDINGLITKPVPQIISSNHVVVNYPIEGKVAIIDFDNIDIRKNEMNCTISVDYEGRYFKQRINLLSSSSRQSLARELKEYYGSHEWLNILIECTGIIESANRSSTSIIDIATVQESRGIQWFVPYTLPLGEASLIFGPGDSGKTYFAMYIAMLSALGGQWLETDFWLENAPVLWIDYETRPDGSTVRFRVDRLLKGIGVEISHGLFFYEPGNGIPLYEKFDKLDRFIKQEGIGFVVVDSALKACGSEVRDEASVGQYFSAIQALGVTSLTLAHVTKDENPDSPFGSVFWINEPHGYVWYLSKLNRGEVTDDNIIVCTNKKANDGRKPEPFSVVLHFDDVNGPVTVSPYTIPDEIAKSHGKSLRTMLVEYIGDDKAGVDELADFLGKTNMQVLEVLQKYNDFISIDGGKTWKLKKF